MLVTLPFVLLLLDYWPLGRIAECGMQSANSRLTPHASRLTFHVSRTALLPLLLEKLPFFALSALSSVVTFLVQKHGGAVEAIERLPLGARSGNALISYCRYLGKLFWPTDLAVFYPHPGYWPPEKVLLAGGLILGISVLLVLQWRRSPFLLMGWLWFVGTLVPAIGLVQVGSHAMADRYTYLPSLGVLVLAIWGAYELTRRWRYSVPELTVAGGAAIVLCLALTRQQLGYWKDSETLFRHALAVTENNRLARINLGAALVTNGQIDEAITHFQEAIRLRPGGADGHNNLGVALGHKGQTDEAIRQYQEAIRLKPAYAEACYNLGNALLMKGQIDQAIRQFQEALRLKAEYAEAHNNLGVARLAKGQPDEAISQCQQALRLIPGYPEARFNLGNALLMKGQIDQAISQYQQAIRLKPDYAEAHYNLGNALLTKGQIDETIRQYQEAIRLKPDYAEALGTLAGTLDGQGKYEEAIRFYLAALKAKPDQDGILNNLAWLLASCPDAAFRNGPEAVRLATRACELTGYAKPLVIGTLAAAQAEAGDFPAAIATAERAAALATTLRLEAVAAKNRELIQLYRQRQPFHEKKGG
jgi:tetratricopeptide (TPR) repeat protein